jgi:hypothetical protein
MPADPPPLAHVRAGVCELVLDVAQTSVTEYDLNSLSRRVCVQLTELCGLSACVVMLVDGTGSVCALIGSDPEAEQLTRLVRQLGNDSSGTRARRVAPAEDLTQARTVVADAAGKVGLPVTASIELYGVDEAVGCLQLFGSDLGTLPEEMLRALLPLADVLGTALHDAGAYEHSAKLVAQLSEALESQRPIEQAKGLLAERHGVDLDAAYRMLRDQARRRDTSVTLVAAELIGQTWQPSGRTVPERGAELSDTGTAPLPEQRGGPTDRSEVERNAAG